MSEPRSRTANRPKNSFRWQSLPICDAAGRFSFVRLAVLALLCAPAALVAQRYLDGALGARPINEALHQIGNWTLWLLLVSLAVRPARALFDLPRLMPLRRMIGVAVFCYAIVHFGLYMTQEAFDLAKVATEIVRRIYLTIGFVALAILAALAATSTDAMARRLGGKRWRRLHQLVYLAGVLSVLHFFMQVKANTDETWIAAGIFIWLMAFRLLPRPSRARIAPADWLPLALAVAAATAIAAAECIFIWLKFGADPLAVAAANLTFETGARPAVIVLAVCGGAALVGLIRQRRPVLSRSPA
jgi:sulfoxide reductase heme-binding subunit YedZ